MDADAGVGPANRDARRRDGGFRRGACPADKGRSYERAVQDFEPYRLVQEPNHAARDAMRQIAERSLQRKKPAFLFVNNRLEGHAPSTIQAVAEQLDF